MTTAVEEQLLEFTSAYADAIEAALIDEGGERVFGEYALQTPSRMIFQASDAWVAFYTPDSPVNAPQVGKGHGPYFKHGTHAYDFSNFDLNTVLQSTTFHFLRVAARTVGEDALAPLTVPPEVAIPNTLNVSLLASDRILRAAEAGRPLTTLVVTPTWAVKTGRILGVRPYRLKIWAHPVPGEASPSRAFVWTHADIWWKPDALLRCSPDPVALARQDVLAFKVLHSLPRSPGTSARPQATPNPLDAAASRLDELCDEFDALLSAEASNEEALHQWLAQPEHHIFLEPHHKWIRSKVRFGTYVSDFVIRRADNTYVLVEIEPAATPIFTGKAEPSHRFNHACQQVRDWQRYVRDNVLTVRTEQDLPGLDSPEGLVILGRSAQMASGESHVRWRDIKARGHNEMRVFTFDELISRVRALAASLRLMMKIP